MKTILIRFRVERYDNELVKGLVMKIVDSGAEVIEVEIK